MKTSLVAVALVAVASSLVTVSAVELFRNSRPRAQPDLALEPARETAAAIASPDVEPVVPAPTDYEDRLLELERRIAALELSAGSHRAPVEPPAGELPTEDKLRELVFQWVAEERAFRSQAGELEAEDKQRKEMEFDARYAASMMAQKHGLVQWQQDELAKLYLETAVRTKEIEGSIGLEDDPAEVEARWKEFDEWCEQRERELAARLGLLYEQIYGKE